MGAEEEFFNPVLEWERAIRQGAATSVRSLCESFRNIATNFVLGDAEHYLRTPVLEYEYELRDGQLGITTSNGKFYSLEEMLEQGRGKPGMSESCFHALLNAQRAFQENDSTTHALALSPGGDRHYVYLFIKHPNNPSVVLGKAIEFKGSLSELKLFASLIEKGLSGQEKGIQDLSQPLLVHNSRASFSDLRPLIYSAAESALSQNLSGEKRDYLQRLGRYLSDPEGFRLQQQNSIAAMEKFLRVLAEKHDLSTEVHRKRALHDILKEARLHIENARKSGKDPFAVTMESQAARRANVRAANPSDGGALNVSVGGWGSVATVLFAGDVTNGSVPAYDNFIDEGFLRFDSPCEISPVHVAFNFHPEEVQNDLLKEKVSISNFFAPLNDSKITVINESSRAEGSKQMEPLLDQHPVETILRAEKLDGVKPHSGKEEQTFNRKEKVAILSDPERLELVISPSPDVIRGIAGNSTPRVRSTSAQSISALSTSKQPYLQTSPRLEALKTSPSAVSVKSLLSPSLPNPLESRMVPSTSLSADHAPSLNPRTSLKDLSRNKARANFPVEAKIVSSLDVKIVAQDSSGEPLKRRVGEEIKLAGDVQRNSQSSMNQETGRSSRSESRNVGERTLAQPDSRSSRSQKGDTEPFQRGEDAKLPRRKKVHSKSLRIRKREQILNMLRKEAVNAGIDIHEMVIQRRKIRRVRLYLDEFIFSLLELLDLHPEIHSRILHDLNLSDKEIAEIKVLARQVTERAKGRVTNSRPAYWDDSPSTFSAKTR